VTGRALALRYGAFAVAATLANLAAQRAVLGARDDATGFAAAVAAGTLVGLALKYVLDKRWIFHDRATGLAAHGHRFTLYAATGAVTTALFWSTESVFWLIWGSDLMREAGAVLGLAVGYVIKYRLDRRFVFPSAGGAGGRHA
jgi:putative flippase GtrA